MSILDNFVFEMVSSCDDDFPFWLFFLQPCRIFLAPADVQFMFSEMITKCEQQFLRFVPHLCMVYFFYESAIIHRQEFSVQCTFRNSFQQRALSYYEVNGDY